MAKTLGAWAIGLAVSAAAAGAHGQTLPTEPAPAPTDPAVHTQAVDEVVVTARTRTERAQDAPVTVKALSGDTLAQTGAVTLFQAVTQVPGVIFSRAPDDGLGLTFRGLGTISRSAELEQSISLTQDGVPLAKGRLYSNATFDVDRLEFVKGTQSTLGGKNSSLGAIGVIDRQPGRQPSFEARAGYEAVDGGYLFDAAGDAPLGDRAAMRLAAHFNDEAGWVRNVLTGHDGPELKDFGGRATVVAAVNDTINLTAFYQFARDEQIGASMQLVGANLPAQYGDGVLDDRNAFFNSYTHDHETEHRTLTHIGSIKLDWTLGDYVMSSQTAFVHYDLYFLDDLDFSPDNTLALQRREHYDQVSEELRVQSPAGRRFEYVAGAFFLGSWWRSSEAQFWAVPNFPPPPDPASGQLFRGPFIAPFNEDILSYAGFASGTWRATDRLKLVGGIRVSRVEKDATYARMALAPLTIWNTIANPPFDATPLSHASSFVDGNASLQYELTRDVMAYASFSHGSKAGGHVETNSIAVPPSALVNGKVPAALVASNSFVDDELATTYEIGLKTRLLDRRLRLNIAAYATDIDNFQDTVFTGGPLGFIAFNAPTRGRGGELEVGWREGGFNLDGGLTYSDATSVIQPIDQTTGVPEVDAKGQPIQARFRRSQAPEFVGNVTTGYTHRFGIYDAHVRADVRYRSSMYNQRQQLFYSPALTTLNLEGGVTRGPWSLDLAINNATNAISEDFASAPPDPRFAAFYGAHAASPNRLRTVLLTASVRY